jgi:tetratricopeptide (TPR) repeat protein
VDLKQFEAALADFDQAQRLQPENYVSLGLLANKGLAHEGLAQWQQAVDCYTRSIDIGRSVAADEPYILNSRGNCFISLGNYQVWPHPPQSQPSAVSCRCVFFSRRAG